LPVVGKVTSEFGLRNGRPHKGIDIANKKGTPILAAMAGKVAYSGRQRGYGNVIILEHANSVMTVYAHNETNLVRVDELVKKGQPIATLGSSGVSSGPHLHFEYREQGRAINPRDILPQLD
jgi:murein DD-endopeptidase MepM/ murein hydrolase activator NlpD